MAVMRKKLHVKTSSNRPPPNKFRVAGADVPHFADPNRKHCRATQETECEGSPSARKMGAQFLLVICLRCGFLRPNLGNGCKRLSNSCLHTRDEFSFYGKSLKVSEYFLTSSDCDRSPPNTYVAKSSLEVGACRAHARNLDSVVEGGAS